ncbi:MAG: toll/interleukin-1 receptor domain-containing protein [Chloroflexi bacterium]|nr:toll/interleukin-1 receptor domain-containing protein [Chloroflexota bacterium]
MTPKELFLSHSSHNTQIASAITGTLRNHGVPVWYSQTNILTAQQWHDEIGNALRRCDWFMVLLSIDSVQSIWVKRELLYALTYSQYEDHIMPVIIEHCNYEGLSWTLDQFQMADYSNNAGVAYAQILARWGLGFDDTKVS